MAILHIFHRMINFYRIPSCAFCDEVESKLKELVLAHRIHMQPAASAKPYLTEGKQSYHTEVSIRRVLREIGGEIAISRAAQSDACMIDPDGTGCL